MMTSGQDPRSTNVELRSHVAKHVSQMQKRYLAKDPRARATLAELRRANPSSDEGILRALTIGFQEVPASLVGYGDKPSRAESAIAISLILYATHQQSLSEVAHQAGWGLGRAVRKLANPSEGDTREKPVMRRFNALATSTSLDEATVHLRGLITQFRNEKIPLDYGRLAEDLYWLQSPQSRTRVRLGWARDLARIDSPTQSPDTTEPAEQ